MYLSSSLEKLQVIPRSDTPVNFWSKQKLFSNSFNRNASNSRGTQFFTSSSLTQSIAREPKFPALSVASEMLSHPSPAKWKMVSRIEGVMMFDKGIQLKRLARHLRQRIQISSVFLSSGANKGVWYGAGKGTCPMNADCEGVPGVTVMEGTDKFIYEVGVA